jgi:hypothetical protein
MDNLGQPFKTCRKCGQPKEPGRCRPCRKAYLSAYGVANRERRGAQARSRYRASEETRERAIQRQYRWRGGNRKQHLEKKRLENLRRRARQQGLTLETYLAQKRTYTKRRVQQPSVAAGPSQPLTN